MSINFIMWVAEMILGIILNVFIGKIAVFIFKKDGTGPRIIIRVAGIVLFINGLSAILSIHLL
ncbi:hypothetical protein E4V42_06970 [Clostridium estertheticum]|uniref:Uncharacterized protein n=1 Tax=Clostridium estertheticum TaxID=238834 RepID=A0A5N7ILJ0_9CLOT|nr:hypothetical protein [Clostridium estertheticum]MPQ31179.1 hypothetical protein [Clostridium estertheticum]MPQ61854.1 hypothetical protein [Clostridium estertheticum]